MLIENSQNQVKFRNVLLFDLFVNHQTNIRLQRLLRDNLYFVLFIFCRNRILFYHFEKQMIAALKTFLLAKL